MFGRTRSRQLLPPALRHSLSTASGSGVRINSGRLLETLHQTCEWGSAHRYGDGPTETGMARLCLTDEDAKVRRWLREEVEKLGCTVTVDQMGNMFARQQGSLGSSAPMTAMGSHLDTQPRGGRYDGILGVLAGLEVLRTMKENGFRTAFDIGWSTGPNLSKNSEEGARPKSMCSSGVWAGAPPRERLGVDGHFQPGPTLRSELERHGLLGPVACSHDPAAGYPLGAHFELHIEQGPILEEAGKSVGVVRGAQGYRWLTITVGGRDAHTGTTPLAARRDPVLAASKMIVASNAIAKRHGALASTGVVKLPRTASTNTVASEVSFTLDIRHPRDRVVHAVQDECLQAFAEIAREDGRGVTLDWTLDTDSAAVEFDEGCIAAVRDAATGLVGEDQWMELTSGAGHDSVYTSRHCPTAMIFVPCKGGVSHHPEEYCSPTQW
ncbi:hypothetical protein NEMBOFW57_008830 [Staphylotrichum longicolle]|uniref:Beta-alanine synthase n=1 Tax=Staphylotrichum longicolle TaxID=669026 RepID=A0AAD4HUA6_9PEZI|nr:hypothetical protein NEMBOFW57_008830 [Staphylotrichum longicolle]